MTRARPTRLSSTRWTNGNRPERWARRAKAAVSDLKPLRDPFRVTQAIDPDDEGAAHQAFQHALDQRQSPRTLGETGESRGLRSKAAARSLSSNPGDRPR